MRVRNNRELQALAQDFLRREPAGTVVVPSGRLGRVLRHRHREEQRRAGRRGWESPRCHALQGLLDEIWRNAWPEESAAPRLLRLRALQELVRSDPPPEGLLPGPELWRELDRSIGALLRDGLDPTAAQAPTVCAWRARVAGSLDEVLRQRGLFHPAALASRVSRLLDAGGPAPSGPFALMALPSPSGSEARALGALGRRAPLVELPLPDGEPPRLRAVTLPDRAEELLWLGEELVGAAKGAGALHGVGVVLPDLAYQAPVGRLLRELFGEDEGFFNVALADPLGAQPLVRAGLLPLRLALAPDRELLLELILSPYHSVWRDHRAELAGADRVWRRRSSAGSLSVFVEDLRAEEPALLDRLAASGRRLDELLAPLGVGGARPLERWLQSLRAIWSALGYPLAVGERDQAALRRFEAILLELGRDLGSTRVGLGELLGWLELALEDERTGEPGSELAGVQVLGMVESRGQSFERVLVPGLSAGCLPPPLRSLPLLTVEERRQLRGGTFASQHEFAAAAYQNLLCCADEVLLSRPLSADAEPLSASPFWPTSSEERRRFLLWDEPSPAWLRAGWVRRVWRSLGEPPPPAPREEPVLALLPRRLAVTSLGALFRCPFRFLLEQLLGLEELAEPEAGISARERGTVVHRILAEIVQQVVARRLDLRRERRRVEQLVVRAVDRALAPHLPSPLWELERMRLLGAADDRSRSRGLLWVWLELERERWDQGWRFVASEISFRGRLAASIPFEVSGRIDRIDAHPDLGELCWDYKTGALPSAETVTGSFVQPQLLAYVAAVRAGLVLGSGVVPMGAGYLGLRSEGELAARPGLSAEDSERVIEQFLAELAELGGEVAAGSLLARPRPSSLDRRAAVRAECDRCVSSLFCWAVAEDREARR